jgi:inorganic triphosphatase YgiF
VSRHSSPVEVELKLLIPRNAVARLLRHPALAKGGRAVCSRLHSIYYDTPALDLQRHGQTLRVRREGRRWVQTIKDEGEVRGGLHRRAELEMAIDGPAPRFAEPSGLSGVLASPRVRAQLRPLFTTDFQRTRRLLQPQPGVRIEASVDRGFIRSGTRRAEVSELELELKAGAPHHLYDLAVRVAEAVPLAISDRSKAERGYALALGTTDSPARASAAALGQTMSVHDAFRAVLWRGLSHLQGNETGMAESRDIEYLHQMRVAVRRLRSAIGIFRPLFPDEALSAARHDLKWLASELGPARDWDVFATETLPAIAGKSGAGHGRDGLQSQCERLRRAAHRRARGALRSDRYRRFTLALAAWLSQEDWRRGLDERAMAALDAPVPDYAHRVLRKRYKRARKKGRGLERLSARELHRLRIAIKKLRYAADFFSGLYEASAVRAMSKRLSRLQDILGAINDAAMATRLAEQAGGVDARRLVLRWRRDRVATLLRDLKRAWREFRATRKFW